MFKPISFVTLTRLATLILFSISITFVALAQTPTIQPTVTVTRNDGRLISGRIITQDSLNLTIESDGMTISIPTTSIAAITYNQGNTTVIGKSTEVVAAQEILRSMRRLAVANDTGVSLINFGPMLIQAKADTIEPLRKIGRETEFHRAIDQSLIAYQHAFEAWQIKIKTEIIFSSDDYGKWAIATYGVKKHGLLRTVFLEEVRQSALSRARSYFQKAEALALEAQTAPSNVQNANDSTTKRDNALVAKWMTEFTGLDGRRETFTLEINAGLTSGRLFGFSGQVSLIESISEDLSDSNTYVITTLSEKINKKQGQVILRVRFATENRLTGTIHLRRIADGTLTPIGQLSAIRVRD